MHRNMPRQYTTRLEGASSSNLQASTESLDAPITLLRIARLWTRLGEQAEADCAIAEAIAALKAAA
jgi:hypothetical protein